MVRGKNVRRAEAWLPVEGAESLSLSISFRVKKGKEWNDDAEDRQKRKRRR